MPERPEKIHKSWEPIIEQHREQAGQPEHREAVRESVAEHVSEVKQQHAAAPSAVADQGGSDDVAVHAKKLGAMQEPDQVAYLGKIALEDGAAKAVSIAEKSGSPYVIDALHDLLVDELAAEMQRRG